jgi:hypothetical protein
VPLLYGTNTLGAACGSLFATAILFRTFDFVTNVRLGALLTGLCAAGALLAVARNPREKRQASAPGTSPAKLAVVEAVAARASPPHSLFAWLLIYSLSGFVALSLEIVWFRVLGVVLKSNAFTFGHLLAVVPAWRRPGRAGRQRPSRSSIPAG